MGRLYGDNVMRDRRVILVGNLLWFGIGSFLLCVILLASYVWMTSRPIAVRTEAMIRLNNLSTATFIYASENDSRLPDAATWPTAIQKHTNEVDFVSPFQNKDQDVRHLMNADLSCWSTYEIEDADQIALYFAGIFSGRVSGGRQDLFYRDGHIAYLVTAGNTSRTVTKEKAAKFFSTPRKYKPN